MTVATFIIDRRSEVKRIFNKQKYHIQIDNI